MTEQRPAPARRSRRRPSPSTVILSSVAAFLALLSFLAFEVRAGRDPALSRPARVAEVQQQPRRVIVRRVEDDYVITKVIPAPSSSTQPSPTTGSSGSGSVARAPVITSSPAPAPAPAPTPAPVTRTS